jgi:uncharacterized protein (DUF433 family)
MNKTEEELIWEAYYNKSKIIKESSDDEEIDEETIGDIIYYYTKGGASIEDIADEYDMEIDEVEEIIRNHKEKRDDSDIIDDFKINPKKHHDRGIGIDQSQRSDTTDREESGYEWEGTSGGFVNQSPEGAKNKRPYELGKKSRRETLDKWGKKYNKKK